MVVRNSFFWYHTTTHVLLFSPHTPKHPYIPPLVAITHTELCIYSLWIPNNLSPPLLFFPSLPSSLPPSFFFFEFLTRTFLLLLITISKHNYCGYHHHHHFSLAVNFTITQKTYVHTNRTLIYLYIS